jgi:hypothetical protein
VKEQPKKVSPWQSAEKQIRDFLLGQEDGETYMKDAAVS